MPTDERLQPSDPKPVERAPYNAADDGVTDALSLYLWRRPASYLARWAALAELSPNVITLVGAVFCLLTFILFWRGEYWWGTLLGLAFMLLDTANGQLARVTGTSSRWGNILEQAIEVVHPPFWWWAWEHGLAAYGRPLHAVYATMVLWVVVGGYVAERAIEGLSIQRFGFKIQLWRRLDSRFQLIAASRSPNLVILAASLLFRRPDSGFVALAWWTLISLIFHAVRFAQMTERQARGEMVNSWIEA